MQTVLTPKYKLDGPLWLVSRSFSPTTIPPCGWELRVLLDREPDIAVVAEAENGEEALAKVLAHRPDVAVLDCQLPGLAGPEVAREIRQRVCRRACSPSAPTGTRHYIRGMLEAGAVGYLLKEEAPEAIVEAVRAAVQGRRYFSPGVADLVQAILEGRARRR